MAVAAYGSLVSLLNVLHNVHDRAQRRNLHVDINLIESLQTGVNCLVDYVEVHSEGEGQRDLWRRMSRMAFETEQMFDRHVVDQLQLRSQGQKGDLGILGFNEGVQEVIQQVQSIKKELAVIEKVPEDVQTRKQPVIVVPSGDSSATFFSGKNTMVGFEEHLLQIKDRLTSDQRHLQIIPIVGMGGIGKTTLAQSVFNDALIVEQFDLRIWITISQEYSVHRILTGLLNHVILKNVGGNFHELGENLYKELFGRRYLIVMDDVWGTEAWNDLRVFFPNNCNRSRIMMTTRLADLASSLGFQDSYVVTFLDEDKSWNLFCQTIFAQQVCPYPELEEIGRSIARSCKGLPLEIVVIGSHLAHSDMSKESWQFVAENMKSFGDIEDYEHCMEVLSLSYKKLPIHLKLCFLCMRVFPEDEKISVDYLIARWSAEGFIKPGNSIDLLEIGKKYLKDLTARNLIARTNSLSSGLLKEEEDALHMHDLFRDLCLKEWEKEQYICSPKIQSFELNQSNAQDACFHCGTSHCDVEATNLMESVVFSPMSANFVMICRGCETMYSELKRPSVVKVANIVENDNFSRDLVFPTQLSYAKVNVQSCSLKMVSCSMLQLLWNLQTLYFVSFSRSSIILPPEIWELSQLRHVGSNGRQCLVLPHPTDTQSTGEDFVMLKNLSFLGPVLNLEFTEEIINQIPNLTNLWIKYEDALGANDMERLHTSLCNLSLLQKINFLCVKDAALQHAVFPKSLKILRIKRCKISWNDITMIGSLPNLEGITLDKSGEGPQWTPVEGEFPQLKLLVLKNCDLRLWNADQVHFPKLVWLWLQGLRILEEIPSDIGNIPTLKLIQVNDCNEHVDESAKQIWEEQEEMGNESLQIEINDQQYRGR